MNTKGKLKTLIEEGNRILHFNEHDNEHDYLVWKEKVESTIEREYGKESTEYQKISHSDLKPTILTGNPDDSVERRKKNIERILVKLEAWEELDGN